jgi:hypothetical protein
VRLRLVAADLTVLVVGLLLTYGLRAALAHPDLLTGRSLATFVSTTLVFAAPLVGLAFAEAGLYSPQWTLIGWMSIVVAVGWATVGTLFTVVAIGPDNAPLATALLAFVVLSAAFVGERQLMRRHAVGDRA